MFASATQGGHKKYLQIASPVLLNSCETFYNVYARKKENSECPESARWTPAQCAWPLKDVTEVHVTVPLGSVCTPPVFMGRVHGP